MGYSKLHPFIIFLFIISSSSVSATEAISKDARFDVGFSSHNHHSAQNLIIESINHANSSILVASYSFTSAKIAQALVNAHNRNVNVQMVTDKSNINKKSKSGYKPAITMLVNAGISVRVNSSYRIQHNKFMIIDERHLETGSFNYSVAADKSNAENVLVLWDVPEIASAYKEQWDALWDGGVDVKLKSSH